MWKEELVAVIAQYYCVKYSSLSPISFLFYMKRWLKRKTEIFGGSSALCPNCERCKYKHSPYLRTRCQNRENWIVFGCGSWGLCLLVFMKLNQLTKLWKEVRIFSYFRSTGRFCSGIEYNRSISGTSALLNTEFPTINCGCPQSLQWKRIWCRHV